MADSDGEGWTKVRGKELDLKGLPPAQRERQEDRYIREWERDQKHWSGQGKHVANARHLHDAIRVDSDLPLGIGAYGQVDAVTYRHVRLARKRIMPKHRLPVDQLKEEARVMERLAHGHIVRLVGTYSFRRYELFLLLWPVAVCTLADFLDDLDNLRSGTGDRDDILVRMRELDLRDLSAVEAQPQPQPQQPHQQHQHQQHQHQHQHQNGEKKATCPLRFLQRILGCLAQALAHIHQADVRHLDLKPSNILLNPGGVYIADFGIARGLEDGEGTMTMGGRGTKKWRAPETWDISNRWSMQAVDVYALGLVYLAVATVLHRTPYWEFDDVLAQPPEQRPALLAAHRDRLAPLATAQVHGTHATTTTTPDCDRLATPREILGLTSVMLSSDAAARPRARDIDLELALLGGIEQAYHGPCCRKSDALVAARMDERHGAVCEDARRARAESARLGRDVDVLRRAGEVLETRMEKEKHAARVRLAEEVERSRALEERIRELEEMVAEAGGRKGRPIVGPLLQQYGAGKAGGGGGGGAAAAKPRAIAVPKPAAIPRPQAQPIQRIRSSPQLPPPPSLSHLRAPSEPVAPQTAVRPLLSAHRPSDPLPRPHHPQQHPHQKLLTSFVTTAPATTTSVVASITPSVTPSGTVSQHQSFSAVTARGLNTNSPSPNGYSLRSRNSISRLPIPVTPRSITPRDRDHDRDRDTTDSTQASMSSSIFSRASAETQATPASGSPATIIRRRRQQQPTQPERESKPQTDDEEADKDDDDETEGSVLWTTLPERAYGATPRQTVPGLLPSWASPSVPSAASTASVPSLAESLQQQQHPPQQQERQQQQQNQQNQRMDDPPTEIPPPPVGNNLGLTLALAPSPTLNPMSSPTTTSSARSSPALSRAELASLPDKPRMPPTLSSMKSWAEVAGEPKPSMMRMMHHRRAESSQAEPKGQYPTAAAVAAAASASAAIPMRGATAAVQV